MTTSSRFIVLLHGLGRSAFSMRPVARRLAAHGYEVFIVPAANWQINCPTTLSSVRTTVAS